MHCITSIHHFGLSQNHLVLGLLILRQQPDISCPVSALSCAFRPIITSVIVSTYAGSVSFMPPTPIIHLPFSLLKCRERYPAPLISSEGGQDAAKKDCYAQDSRETLPRQQGGKKARLFEQRATALRRGFNLKGRLTHREMLLLD